MAKLKRREYQEELEALQVELTGMAHWLRHTGKRLVVLFEGRDTAGKGGTINAIANRLNPRQVHVVALPKPSDCEQQQWYFQRYAAHLPAAGEIVLFDRSWYNRAGVERVMGFCEPAQVKKFLEATPGVERAMVAPLVRAALEGWERIGHVPDAAVTHLSLAEQEVLWSCWRRGETPIEISAVLGCNKSTVSWHVDRENVMITVDDSGKGVAEESREHATSLLSTVEHVAWAAGPLAAGTILSFSGPSIAGTGDRQLHFRETLVPDADGSASAGSLYLTDGRVQVAVTVTPGSTPDSSVACTRAMAWSTATSARSWLLALGCRNSRVSARPMTRIAWRHGCDSA